MERATPPSSPRRGKGEPLLRPRPGPAMPRGPRASGAGAAAARSRGSFAGRAQVRRRPARAGRAEGPRAEPALLARAAALRGGSDLQLPRCVVQGDASWSRKPRPRAAVAEPRTDLPAERWRCAGRQRATAARGPANSPAAELGKPPPPQRRRRQLRPRRALGAAPCAKPRGRRWAKWPGSRGVLSRAPATRAQALPAGCDRGPRPPRDVRSAQPGRRGLGGRTEPGAPGGAGEGRCTSTHLEPQDLGR